MVSITNVDVNGQAYRTQFPSLACNLILMQQQNPNAYPNSKMALYLCTRHLQIMAGMERDEYVVVYWILITEM